MGRYRIRLDTMKDINEFVQMVGDVKEQVVLESSDGFRTSAKSLLGVMSTVDWSDLFCVSDVDIYTKIEKYVI